MTVMARPRATPVNGRVLAVLHQQTSSPGRVGQWLVRNGYQLEICRPPLGDDLPDDLSSYVAVVVFGGPMSVNDPAPYMTREIAFSAKCLDQGVPFLGICLGAQMLVKALGGTVEPHADGHAEIGYYPLRITAEGEALIKDWPAMIYQWHREGFELPTDAIALAKGDAFEEQAFQIGPSAFGVQFHTELTEVMMRRWLVRGRERLTLPGAQMHEAHLEGRLLYDAPILDWKRRFLRLWLNSDQRMSRPPHQERLRDTRASAT